MLISHIVMSSINLNKITDYVFPENKSQKEPEKDKSENVTAQL